MNNRLIIAIFILFSFIVFLSSLQSTHNTPDVSQPTINKPILTVAPTLFLTPTLIPTQIQHPNFRVNVGGEGGDD